MGKPFFMEGQHMSRVVTPATSQPTPTTAIPHDKIAMRAYERWNKKGRPQGTNVQDWLEAEAELKAETSRGTTGGSTPMRR
jgi:hypothetical protein